MTSYIIAYDLLNESGTQDYEPLWEELRRLGSHRTQDSVWLTAVNGTAKELHDHLKSFLDDDDRLWVNELVKNKYFSNARAGTNDWLRDNPPSR